MNRFEKWLLRGLCNRLVTQGPYHRENIIEYYRTMSEAAKKEFYEDNKVTIDGFLTECHDVSLNLTTRQSGRKTDE